MIAYRIADARHPIYDGPGAMLHGGCWNSAGQRVIYAAESYPGAMLAVLVHANLSVPPKHHQVVRITIPNNGKIETLSISDLPGWDAEDLSPAQSFGDLWLRERRTAIFRVPNVVTEGREFNVLINPAHTQAAFIQASIPEPVKSDLRLFSTDVDGKGLPAHKFGLAFSNVNCELTTSHFSQTCTDSQCFCPATRMARPF